MPGVGMDLTLTKHNWQGLLADPELLNKRGNSDRQASDA